MKYLIPIILFLFSTNVHCQEDIISIGNRYKIDSEILNESRYLNIYLPHSYNSSVHTMYPVIYLMDGDYNFHYVTGIIDQMSVIGEKIPEMIVVGLADKGHKTYIKDCTPYNKESNPNGNSTNYLAHILNEVKPFMESQFRIADYDLLIGHSVGGLFVINTLLESYESFDTYIAISPSIWWNDYEAEKNLEDFFTDNENIDKKLYLSLGNEKGMGVFGFQNKLDINIFADEYYKNEPIGLEHQFNYFVNENHNSVGLLSIKAALDDIFKKYELTYDEIDNIVEFEDYEIILAEYRELIGEGFRFPNRQFKQIISKIFENDKIDIDEVEQTVKNNYLASLGDFYHIVGNLYLNEGDTQKAEKYLNTSCEISPNSSEYIVSLADLYKKEEKIGKANELYKDAFELVKKQGTSKWYLNQLESNLNIN